MQITRQNPQNQVQKEKSLARARKEFILYLGDNSKSELYKDEFSSWLPSEIISYIKKLWFSLSPHQKTVFQNEVLYFCSHPYDFRSDGTVQYLTRHDRSRVNKLRNLLVKVGILNKYKPHKFSTCFYGLAPTFRKSNIRSLLASFIPAFKSFCLGVLLSVIPQEFSCQTVMDTHIKKTNSNFKTLTSSYINSKLSLCSKTEYKSSQEDLDIESEEISTPEERLNAIKGERRSLPCAAQYQIEEKLLQKVFDQREKEIQEEISSENGIYFMGCRYREWRHSCDTKKALMSLQCNPQDRAEYQKISRDTSEADKFARLNINFIHRGKYKELYEFERYEYKKRKKMLTPQEKRKLSLPPAYKEKQQQQQYKPPSLLPYTDKPRELPHEDIYISYFKLQDNYRENGNPLNLPNPYRAKFIERVEESSAESGMSKTDIKNGLYKLYLATKEKASDI